MEKEITYTIQGWDTSEGVESIHEELKEYAIEAFGWKEQIENPENPGELIDNPVGYEQVIFYDEPIAGFWAWLKRHLVVEAMVEIDNEIQAIKDQVTVTAE